MKRGLSTAHKHINKRICYLLEYIRLITFIAFEYNNRVQKREKKKSSKQSCSVPGEK